MQLRTSCFNPGLFRKNITRFWPLWAAYGLLWLLLIPAGLLGEHLRRPGAVTREMVDQLVLGLGGQGGIVIAFFYGCACALAVFSYLYQHRSAVAIHSLPLRRECLFITNYLSGLTFFALPLAAVFLLTLAAELLCGAVNLGGLLVWLTAQLCYALFFYSFAVFCAMFTGNALALPPFYGILSVLANVMAWLLDGVLGAFVYGYYDSAVLARSASVLSPLVQLCRRVDFTSRWLEDTGETVYYLTGWGWIILYAVVGAALAGVAGGDPAAVAFKRLQLLSCAGRFQRQVGVEMERHQQPVGLPGGVPDHPAAAPGDGVVPVADEFRHGADLSAAAEESHIQTFGGRTGNAGISPLVRRLFRRDPEVNPVFCGTLRRMDRQRTVVAQPEADRLAVGEYLQGFRRNRQQDFTEVQRGGGIGLFRFRRDPVGSLRHLPVGGTESGEGKQQEQDSTGRTPHYSASVFSSLNARSRRNGGRAKVTGLPASTFSLSSPGRHSPVRGTNQRSR